MGKHPTPLVRVTFPGSVLPGMVVLDGLLLPVQPYRKKAMLCEYCLRTGHTKTFCVVKPKCAKCGSPHNTRDCQLKERSNNGFVCGTDHNPEERSKCPKISQATTHKNQQMKKKLSLSYAEALKNYVQTSNEFELLPSDDEDLEETSEMQLQDQRGRRSGKLPLSLQSRNQKYQSGSSRMQSVNHHRRRTKFTGMQSR